MDPEGRSLADEARMAIEAAGNVATCSPDGPVRAARVRAAPDRPGRDVRVTVSIDLAQHTLPKEHEGLRSPC